MTRDPGFGVSAFMENARYQHALETELARTIASLQNVQGARVHLAMARQSAFVSERRPGSASVFLQIKAGRRLDDENVQAIANLVASSIPELSASQVTVVDQTGRLLSAPETDSDTAMRDKMFEFSHRLEESYSNRIQEMLTPLVGPGRVRAQVVAQVDMTTTESTREQFNPQSQVVRSESTAEEAGAQRRRQCRWRAGRADQSTAAARRRAAARSDARRGAVGRKSRRRQRAGAMRLTTRPAPRSRARIPRRASRRATTRSTAPWPIRARPPVASRACRWPCSSTTCAPRPRMARSPKHRCRRSRSNVSPRWCAMPSASTPTRGDTVNVVNSSFLGTPVIEEGELESIPFWERAWAQTLAKVLAGLLVLLVIVFSVLKPLTKGLLTRRASVGVAPGGAGGRVGRRRGAGGERRRSPTNNRWPRRAAWSRRIRSAVRRS